MREKKNPFSDRMLLDAEGFLVSSSEATLADLENAVRGFRRLRAQLKERQMEIRAELRRRKRR